MRIKKRMVFIALITTLIIFFLAKYISIKQEFSNYLKENYPETSFSIGRIKYDPIYPKIYARVEADNGIEFIIKRHPKKGKIYESYLKKKYEKEAIFEIEKYLGIELLKDIGNIGCYIDKEKIPYPNYEVDDLLANMGDLSINLDNALQNFEEFFNVSNKVFDKLNYNNIEAKKGINVYTYTSDHLDCNLSKENGYYVLRVMVVAEEISTKEEYFQKRKEIQQVIDKSVFKISQTDISYKGDLK